MSNVHLLISEAAFTKQVQCVNHKYKYNSRQNCTPIWTPFFHTLQAICVVPSSLHIIQVDSKNPIGA